MRANRPRTRIPQQRTRGTPIAGTEAVAGFVVWNAFDDHPWVGYGALVAGEPDITRSRDLLVAVLGHTIEASRFACRDLSDEEYYWEPVVPCWGIRRRGESDAPTQYGRGDWIIEMWGHEPPRVTTIGWRLVHLAVGSETFVDTTFEDGASSFADAEIPGTAREAVARLHDAQTRCSRTPRRPTTLL